MKVASITVPAMNHGLMAFTMSSSARLRWLLREDGCVHVHAGTKRDAGRQPIEDDLDGNPLDDLDEVAGGVLGRQQTELGAGGAGNRVDMAGERLAVHVHMDLGAL